MRPFVINGHGRLVFPSNFSADLDFSVLETLEQLEAVVKRDFEAKAPTGSEILERVGALASKSRFTTASSCSRVSMTEKSRCALKLDGKTSRPWPLTTKGLTPALHVHAAVDRPHLPRDVGRRVGAQEVHDARDLLGAA